MKSNKVALAAGNIDLDSPSFGAFFKASKKTVKQDIRRLQVNGLADVVSITKSGTANKYGGTGLEHLVFKQDKRRQGMECMVILQVWVVI